MGLHQKGHIFMIEIFDLYEEELADADKYPNHEEQHMDDNDD